MPSKEKPYRVYRAGRVRGPIAPLPPLEDDPHRLDEAGEGAEPPLPPFPPAEIPPTRRRRPRPPRPRRPRKWVRWTLVVVLALLLAFVGWGLAGYFSLRSGVAAANDRLPDGVRAVLSDQEGSLLSSPTTILLLGADRGPGREDVGRSDAIVLLRTDPGSHAVSMLSIPRDLRVEIPDCDSDKINAAYACGGAARAIQTVQELTGIPVNHVALVDFSTFGEVIDALGGVTIDVPRRIVSNRFDCPYATRARCERWQGWQFEAGKQTMDGRRALVYARIRENQLDPGESDITRGGRQQQVVQAIVSEVDGVGGFFRLPFVGEDVMKPIATDLSTTDLLELGWVKFRASKTLQCRLGGTPAVIDGVAYITGTEDNVSVVSMFTGDTAPQRPRRGDGPFAPGCEPPQ